MFVIHADNLSSWFGCLDCYWLVIRNLWTCVTNPLDVSGGMNCISILLMCLFSCVLLQWFFFFPLSKQLVSVSLIVFSPSAFRFWVRCHISGDQEDAITYSSSPGAINDDEHLGIHVSIESKARIMFLCLMDLIEDTLKAMLC